MTDRQPAEWMCLLDERILENLQREGWSTAHIIERATTMNATRKRVAERLRMLTAAGLVAPIFEGSKMYELTGEGQRYLLGKLDADHQPQPHPRAV